MQKVNIRAVSPNGYVKITKRQSKKGPRYKARVIAPNFEGTMVSDEPINDHGGIITNIVSVMKTFGGQRVLVVDNSNKEVKYLWLDAGGTFREYQGEEESAE